MEEANAAAVERRVDAWLAALAAGDFEPRSTAPASVRGRAELIDPAAASCLPTCDATDARLLTLAGGDALETLVDARLAFRLWSRAGAAETRWGVFDGDSRGVWDLPEDAASQIRFRLYADPDGDLDPATLDTDDDTHPALVQTQLGGTMADDGWSDFAIANTAASQSTDPRAAGDHAYLLIAELVGTVGRRDWNNFKLRSDAGLRLLTRPFVFTAPLFGAEEGCIVYPDACPNGNLTPTTYDGTWTLYLEQPFATAALDLFDGDFDRGSWSDADLDTDDPDTPSADPCPAGVQPPFTVGASPCVPDFAAGTDARTEGVADGFPATCGSEGSLTGCPADDRSSPVFQRAASGGGPLRWTVTAPDGRTAAAENPSGNREWERFRFAAAGVPATTLAFTAPGTDVFTVPAGVFEITAKLWGAGGGGGAPSGNGQAAGDGGGGGYSTCRLTVTPGESLDVHVGGGGGPGLTLFGGGGGGGGGGRSELSRGGTALCVAGGGGGGGGADNGAAGAGSDAGGGGGPSGAGGADALSSQGGGGGTTTAGGGGGAANGTAGAQRAGGSGGGVFALGNSGVSNGGAGGLAIFPFTGAGGGGGSGWFGGGGGGEPLSNNRGGAGGGGGSGSVSGLDTVTLAGSGRTPAGGGDGDYAAPAGLGGLGGAGGGAATAGADGRVVLRYGSDQPATFPAGVFTVGVEGMDLSNLNAWRFDGAVCPLDDAGEPVCSRCPDPLSFDDLTPGTDLAATQPYADLFAPGVGVRFATNVSFPTVFDTTVPTCGDVDLGAPNECYGGPGVAGGADPSDPGGPCGTGATNNPSLGLGNALIVQETAGACVPDDKGGGGPNTLVLTFDLPVFLQAVDLLDLEEDASEIRAYDQFGDPLVAFTAGGDGDNSFERSPVEVGGVRRLEVAFEGSGAVPRILFCSAGFGAPAGAAGATLAGVAWSDSDGDGAFEPEVGELPAVGATVELETVELDSVTPATGPADAGAGTVEAALTDRRGAYRFTGLPAGTYRLRLAGEPASAVTLTLKRGERADARPLPRPVAEPPPVRRPAEWVGRPWPVAYVRVAGVPHPRFALVPLLAGGGPPSARLLVAELVAAKLNVGVGNRSGCAEGDVRAADAWLAQRLGEGAPLRGVRRLPLDGDAGRLLAALERFNRRGCR